MTRSSVTWEFDEPPRSGQRIGGDPSLAAFKVELPTFVREVIQNSLDARSPDADAVGVRFELITLRGSKLQDFMKVSKWKELEPHLDAAADQHYGAPIQAALGRLRGHRELPVLYIHDSGTLGLKGEEVGSGSNFSALCRDELFSHKPVQTAGGSWGLGKAVLWSFSSFRTVLFFSHLAEPDPAGRRYRLFGRTSLPWHEFGNGKQYAGAGWFGHLQALPPTPISVWDDDALRLAEGLGIDRPDISGTSIAVVGFREPAAEQERPTASVITDIRAAAAENFWPALTATPERLQIDTSDAKTTVAVDCAKYPGLRPFVEAVQRARSGGAVASLNEPGDVLVKEIVTRVPARQDGTPAHDGKVSLLVRLADEARDDQMHQNDIAYSRSLGMVLQYRSYPARGLLMRPFHAVVLAGLAALTPDEVIEEWLRAAEPAEHNEWRPTERLANVYKNGSLASLSRLQVEIDRTIRLAVSAASTSEDVGADELSRLFPFGTPGAPPKRKDEFFVEVLDSSVDWQGNWTVKARVGARRAAPNGWSAKVSMSYGGDDRDVEQASFSLVSLTAGIMSIDSGFATVRVPKRGPLTVDFVVRTDASASALGPTAMRLAPLVLDVTGTR